MTRQLTYTFSDQSTQPDGEWWEIDELSTELEEDVDDTIEDDYSEYS